MFQTVLEIIGESVPEVASIDLSNNKIISTEHLSILKKFGSKLKTLNLSHNKVNVVLRKMCQRHVLKAIRAPYIIYKVLVFSKLYPLNFSLLSGNIYALL